MSTPSRMRPTVSSLLEVVSFPKTCNCRREHVYADARAGAVGIEMAAELKLVHPSIKVTLVHSRNQLLSNEPLCDELKDRALELVREMDVEVILNRRVKETKTEVRDGVKKKEIELSDGTKLVASEVLMALSKSVPSSSFFPASALDDEGYVKITPR